MSTRATYRFTSAFDRTPDTTFYIHHDGYLAGAAQYLHAMVDHLTVADNDGYQAIEERRGGCAFAFIRANMRAEVTASHEQHGDTEYRYNVHEDKSGHISVVAQQRNLDSGAWREVWRGDLADFTNAYDMDGYPKSRIVRWNNSASKWDSDRVCTKYATSENAGKIAAKYRADYEKYGEDNPNGYAARVVFERIGEVLRWDTVLC